MGKKTEQLVIVGSGPAALTAAIYAARAELKPIVIQGSEPGGQLMGTSVVENWPGEKSIMGPRLMQNMMEHAKAQGAQIAPGSVVSIHPSGACFDVITDQNETYIAQAVLIATGSRPRRLGCPGEDEYWGKGITTCAVCDGALYKDKNVLVIGGGDSGAQDALFLTKFTKKVTLIQNKNRLTASKINTKRIRKNEHVQVMYNSSVVRFEGDKDRVHAAYIQNVETEQELKVNIDGVFLAIGLIPNTDFCKKLIKLNTWGYILVDEKLSTSISGIFAAGDVHDYRYRQAITAAGDGCRAALEIEHYLNAQE